MSDGNVGSVPTRIVGTAIRLLQSNEKISDYTAFSVHRTCENPLRRRRLRCLAAFARAVEGDHRAPARHSEAMQESLGKSMFSQYARAPRMIVDRVPRRGSRRRGDRRERHRGAIRITQNFFADCLLRVPSRASNRPQIARIGEKVIRRRRCATPCERSATSRTRVSAGRTRARRSACAAPEASRATVRQDRRR